MEELVLDESLYNQIAEWMIPLYATTTQHERQLYLRRLFKTYRVLNQETLREIMKTIKYQHQRACLCMINDYCYDNKIPFHLRIPSIKKQSAKLPDILSPEEIELMIKAAPPPYDLAIRCIFNMGAGLRVSEIIKFCWDDIRWIDWLKNQDNYGIAKIKTSKGSKDRIVNIPKKLMADLYQFAKEEGVLNEYRIPTGRMIFPFGEFILKKEKRMGEFLKIKRIDKWKREYIRSKYNWFRYNIIQQHCEKALNKRIRIHLLRHSRSTYLYEYEKVPVEQLSMLLGHASLNTTMVYTKVNPVGVFEKLKYAKEI